MHGARIVSGKILSVSTDPGESIENVTFARVRNVFEKFSLSRRLVQRNEWKPLELSLLQENADRLFF